MASYCAVLLFELPRGFERAHHPSRSEWPRADVPEEVSVILKGKALSREDDLPGCLRGTFVIYF